MPLICYKLRFTQQMKQQIKLYDRFTINEGLWLDNWHFPVCVGKWSDVTELWSMFMNCCFFRTTPSFRVVYLDPRWWHLSLPRTPEIVCKSHTLESSFESWVAARSSPSRVSSRRSSPSRVSSHRSRCQVECQVASQVNIQWTLLDAEDTLELHSTISGLYRYAQLVIAESESDSSRTRVAATQVNKSVGYSLGLSLSVTSCGESWTASLPNSALRGPRFWNTADAVVCFTGF